MNSNSNVILNQYNELLYTFLSVYWSFLDFTLCLRNEKPFNILLWQGWLLVGLLTYQTLRKAPGLYATSLIPFSRPNHPHKVSFLLFLKTIWCLFSFFVNSGDGLIFERTSSFSSYCLQLYYILDSIIFYFLIITSCVVCHVLLDCILPSLDSA